MLRLSSVSKSFEPVEGQATHVLKGLDLSLVEGEMLAVVGPSGSGKSTLLFLLGALERPTAGTITWDGKDLTALGTVELARFRNREVGFVFQQHHLLPQLSAFENVLVPTLAGGSGDRTALEARARELLEAVGLKERMAHRPAQLSGGERQRVACVRALINKPRLLLADEPTGSLDRRAADELTDLLLHLNEREGFAGVMVTHSSRLAERMHRCLELRDGRLVPFGAAEEQPPVPTSRKG